MSQIEPQENIDYDDPIESISNDAIRRGLSNDQIWAIWQAGLAAQPVLALDGANCPSCQAKSVIVGTQCLVCGVFSPRK